MDDGGAPPRRQLCPNSKRHDNSLPTVFLNVLLVCALPPQCTSCKQLKLNVEGHKANPETTQKTKQQTTYKAYILYYGFIYSLFVMSSRQGHAKVKLGTSSFVFFVN